MKKLILLAVAAVTTLAATPSAEARDRRHGYRHGGHHGYRSSGYCAPRIRTYCPPPVYYAPRYCAPRPVCPPRFGYGYAVPRVQLSFGYVGRPYRW